MKVAWALMPRRASIAIATCVNKVALFDSDGRRIYKKRVPCEF